MKSSQMTEEKAIKLLRIAYLVLLCQNILIFLMPIAINNILNFLMQIIININNPTLISSITYFIVFTVDLLGFLFLSVGYILFSQFSAKKKVFLGGGFCFLGWVMVRIISQYILPIIIFGNVQVFFDMVSALGFGGMNLVDMYTYIDMNEPPLTTLSYDRIYMLNFILGGFLLAAGTFLIWWAQKGKDHPTQSAKGERMFLFYGLFNLFSIMVFIPLEYFSGGYVSKSGGSRLIGTYLKCLIVPLIGIITFNSMYKKFRSFSWSPKDVI